MFLKCQGYFFNPGGVGGRGVLLTGNKRVLKTLLTTFQSFSLTELTGSGMGAETFPGGGGYTLNTVARPPGTF